MNIFEIAQKCLATGREAVYSALGLKAGGRSAELFWAALNGVQEEEPYLIANLNGIAKAIMKTEANANFQIGRLKGMGLIERASDKRGMWRLTASVVKKLEKLAEGEGGPTPAPTQPTAPTPKKPRPRKTKSSKKISKTKNKKSAKKVGGKKTAGKAGDMTVNELIAKLRSDVTDLDARIELMAKNKEEIRKHIADLLHLIKR